MAIDKITTSGLSIENLEIEGTEAAKMPVGTTAQRANVQAGDIRFNSTLSLMEYYDGTIWKAIDSPPVVSSISPTSESDGSANITITGSNFQSGATVQFIGNDGTVYNSPSVTVNSSTEVVATTPSTPLSVANEPYDIKLTNTSGLAGTLADALDAGGVPSWNTASGTIFTIYDAGRGSVSTSVSATDPDGDTITYAIASGDSLPSGLSLNSSTGAITGSTSAVGSDTTTTFDIEASTASGDTVSRTFNIVQKAPVVTSYTSTGSGTFTVPSGVTAVDVLVVAGGGGGGVWVGGGGGAGGLIYRPAFPVTPGGSVSYSVGSGGAGAQDTVAPSNPEGAEALSAAGQDSTFGGLTAKGGGGGGSYPGSQSQSLNGGSGGGASDSPAGSPSSPVGTGTQPQQPGDSGTYGFGNNGSLGIGGGPWVGGGGGGAGGAGVNATNPIAGQGGVGKQYDISGSQVYYAGGGGGGVNGPPSASRGLGGNGGGADGAGASPDFNQGGQTTAPSGTANRGGGGGGNGYPGPSGAHYGGAGGSGIVIVKY